MPGGGSARAENNRANENDYIKYMRFSLFLPAFAPGSAGKSRNLCRFAKWEPANLQILSILTIDKYADLYYNI